MQTTLTPELAAPILESLIRANQAHAALFPGQGAERQPIHTVYGGAHLFHPETAANLGSLALKLLKDYAPGAGGAGKLRGPAGRRRFGAYRLRPGRRQAPA